MTLTPRPPWLPALGLLVILSGCASMPRRHGQEKPFPTLSLAAPETAADRASLGLTGGSETVSVSDVQADVVVVMAFDMYCRFCQKSAPLAAVLHDELAACGGGRRVKMIGIGVGNSAYEAALFRSTYALPFPVLPDPGSTLLTALGPLHTPTFFIVRTGTAPPCIARTHSGIFLTASGARRFARHACALSPPNR